MVGVPGKYKGCETCRRRRVKCDNARPLCRRCLDNGRDCEGYQRERVFISAGVEDGGRCSSHPPRRVSGSTSSSHTPQEPQRFALEQAPGSTAWDDTVMLSSRGAQNDVPVVAIHADLRSMTRVDAGGGLLVVDNAAHSMPDFRTPFGGVFGVTGQCLVHTSVQEAGRNLCAFVYELSFSSPTSGDMLLWDPESEKKGGVRSQGPQAFQTFPAHHFFARIYRPLVIGKALLNRHETFLASPEWTTTPWTTHPKTPLDTLLDKLSRLPELLSRTDAVLSTPVTPHHQLTLQDLLATAQHIETSLDDWHTGHMPGHWLDGHNAELYTPLGGALSFDDGMSALACIYYWTGLLLFQPCVLALRRALAPHYGFRGDGQGTRLAGDICRSLDFALRRTAQPDLLIMPLLAVERFYGGEASGLGAMELAWCAGFRERLVMKGEYLAGLLRGRKWAELGRF